MKRIVFHPEVQTDIDQIMAYYENVANEALAGDFYDEFISHVRKAAAQPSIFTFRLKDLRRVNLSRFPYHFLFRVVEDSIRILVVRHHRRHPALGTKRK